MKEISVLQVDDKDPNLQEIVRRLVQEFRPHKVFLFGSRATETATEDSDYDILVVVPELREPAHRLAIRAHHALSGLGIAKDIFFISREKFELRKSIVNTLAEIAYSDGKELYAA